MSGNSKVRLWPRFVGSLSVECTFSNPGERYERRLAGETLNVGAGGLALLLDETLPLGIPVLVNFCQEEPLRGHVVWTDQRTRTVLGTTVAHGVAFEHPVDPARVREWVQLGERRSHIRAPVKLNVEYTQSGTTGHGTCLNLSQGGMFIATERPVVPGTEVMLFFTLPSLSEPLSVPARVAWISREETEPGAISGMGVKFVDLNPLEAAVIGSLVDRVCAETPTPDSSQFSTPTR